VAKETGKSWIGTGKEIVELCEGCVVKQPSEEECVRFKVKGKICSWNTELRQKEQRKQREQWEEKDLSSNL
jgi:hypothetical protein